MSDSYSTSNTSIVKNSDDTRLRMNTTDGFVFHKKAFLTPPEVVAFSNSEKKTNCMQGEFLADESQETFMDESQDGRFTDIYASTNQIVDTLLEEKEQSGGKKRKSDVEEDSNKNHKTMLLLDNVVVGIQSDLKNPPDECLISNKIYTLAGNPDHNGTRKFMDSLEDKNEPLPKLVCPPVNNINIFKHPQEIRCPHCKFAGNWCHNKRYGRYCVIMTVRYRREVGSEKFTVKGAKEAFVTAYAYAHEFEHFLNRTCIPAELKKDVPLCMKLSSLPLALNINEWYMITTEFETALEFTKKKQSNE